MTYTKFHMRPNGFSDYCPIQLAYTDDVPTSNPALTTFTHVEGGPGRSEATTASVRQRTSSPFR